MREFMKYLSLDEFKKWVEEQSDFDHNIEKKIKPLIGTYVEAKSNFKKILHCMMLEEGNRKEVAKDFYENGGQIKDTNENIYLIEVSCGSFHISKNHIKR
jgi:hypothetical protein